MARLRTLIIYIQQLLDSDWLKKECSFYVTPVQSCNTSANYKWVLIGSKTIEAKLEPIRLKLLTGQTVSEGLERAKTYLIHAKVSQINENDKYINESTSNWTFGQHERGFTKLLQAYNREFPHATVRYEG